VEARTITYKRGPRAGQTGTAYDITTADGLKWTAWERETAEAAYELSGKPVIMDVKIEKNGDYENRTLKAILPDEAAPAGASFTTPTFPPIDPTTTNTTAAITYSAPQTSATSEIPMALDQTTSIHRQTAGKVAALISKTPDEFWANVEQLVHYFATGQTPGSPVTSNAAPVIPDDDIPF
jgi:hypothetical protein